MILNRSSAFTLIELLVSVFILMVGISGTFALFSQSMLSASTSWDHTTATSHAESILEEMTTLAPSEITIYPWQEWIVNQDLLTLPEEEIDVAYDVPVEGMTGVTVTVRWIHRNRQLSIQLYSEFPS